MWIDKMKCHVCKKSIDGAWVAIKPATWSNEETGVIYAGQELFTHMDCFGAVAGKEWLQDLYDIQTFEAMGA